MLERRTLRRRESAVGNRVPSKTIELADLAWEASRR